MQKGCQIGVGVTLLCFFGICFLFWDFGRIKSWGVNVDAEKVEWIPTEASDVTFISGDINKIAEFSIDRTSLKRWCDSIGKPLSPVVEDNEARLMRANLLLERIGAAEKPEGDDEYFTWRNKAFEKGDLFYEERWPNNGGYAIGYDVTEGRAYFNYAHH